MKKCAYEKTDREKFPLVTSCEGKVAYAIKKYYVNGMDIILCEHHAKEFNELHPFSALKAEKVVA